MDTTMQLSHELSYIAIKDEAAPLSEAEIQMLSGTQAMLNDF